VSTLHSTMRLTDFLLDEMANPAFEITAFSPTLDDPYSQEMMTKTTELALAARDVRNRTEREIARLNDELQLQKDALRAHLNENNKLNKLEEQLLTSKLYTIQSMGIELISRQIATLENFLSDGVKTRVENVAQERKLIEEELLGMRAELSRLPKKWLAEHKLKQRLDLNKRMMDEVARLIESKNISYHLETIQSAPLDAAVAPLLPKSPRIALFASLGAFLGLLGACSLFTLQAMRRGIKASSTNLRLADQFVAGSLSSQEPLNGADLATLRRLSTYLFLTEAGKSALLVQGKGPDYSQFLASLLAKQQRKVIVINLTADTHVNTDQPGLYDYLEGKASTPYIARGNDYDQILAGGINHYAKELVSSLRFTDLLKQLSKDYDQLIAVAKVLPMSPEAESYAQLFDSVAVSLSTETIEELEDYIALPETKKIAFLFT
jgi:tyrosine-protein kinase Etk/Wzc